jgi:small nuclear ribonucleoprotein (snRNP)-like protein
MFVQGIKHFTIFQSPHNLFCAALSELLETLSRRNGMSLVRRTLSRCVGLLLICALLAPTVVNASPAPHNPDQVQALIRHLGINGWVGVQLKSGVAFSGKIVRFDEHGFDLLKYGETENTPVLYGDVNLLTTPLSVYGGLRKPLTADDVHARIVKAGLGKQVGVQLQNGVVFEGTILSFDDNSFELQLYGDPKATPVAYGDVVYLYVQSNTAGYIVLGLGIAATVILILVAHHEMNKMKQQTITMPVMPTQPGFPY